MKGMGLNPTMFIQLTIYIVLLTENILVVLGLNPSDSSVSYAPFLAPVDTALICRRIKKVLEGHGLESQVMFIELATYIVSLRENIQNVHPINYLNSITERNFFSGPGFESQ